MILCFRCQRHGHLRALLQGKKNDKTNTINNLLWITDLSIAVFLSVVFRWAITVILFFRPPYCDRHIGKVTRTIFCCWLLFPRKNWSRKIKVVN